MMLAHQKYGLGPDALEIELACVLPHDHLVDEDHAVTLDELLADERWENEGGSHLTHAA